MSVLPGDFWEALPLGAGVRMLVRDGNGLAAFDKPFGVLSHPNEAQDEPGVWVSYQEEYMGSPLAGPVLLTPAAWRELAQAIEDRLQERDARK